MIIVLNDGPICKQTYSETLIFSLFSDLRVTPGLWVLRASRGLQGDQVSQASKDQRGIKVTMAVVASWVRKEVW